MLTKGKLIPYTKYATSKRFLKQNTKQNRKKNSNFTEPKSNLLLLLLPLIVNAEREEKYKEKENLSPFFVCWCCCVRLVSLCYPILILIHMYIVVTPKYFYQFLHYIPRFFVRFALFSSFFFFFRWKFIEEIRRRERTEKNLLFSTRENFPFISTKRTIDENKNQMKKKRLISKRIEKAQSVYEVRFKITIICGHKRVCKCVFRFRFCAKVNKTVIKLGGKEAARKTWRDETGETQKVKAIKIKFSYTKFILKTDLWSAKNALTKHKIQLCIVWWMAQKQNASASTRSTGHMQKLWWIQTFFCFFLSIPFTLPSLNSSLKTFLSIFLCFFCSFPSNRFFLFHYFTNSKNYWRKSWAWNVFCWDNEQKKTSNEACSLNSHRHAE